MGSVGCRREAEREIEVDDELSKSSTLIQPRLQIHRTRAYLFSSHKMPKGRMNIDKAGLQDRDFESFANEDRSGIWISMGFTP